MRLLLGSLFALVVAAVVGLGATWLALTRGTAFGALTIGAWTAWPKTGTPDIDPYARATIARSGELPIGSATASPSSRRDRRQRPAARRPLRRRLISGITPQARFWTLTLYDPRRRAGRQLGRPPGLHQPGDRAPRRRQLRDRRRRRARSPATGCRPAASSATCWCCGSTTPPVGVATTRGREAPMPAVDASGAAHDPLAALAARRRAARRHRASRDGPDPAAHRDAGRLFAAGADRARSIR